MRIGVATEPKRVDSEEQIRRGEHKESGFLDIQLNGSSQLSEHDICGLL